MHTKGRGRIWSGCPTSGLIHISRVSGYRYKMNLHQVSIRKNFFYKSYKRFSKIKKSNFLETTQPILMAKICVIEGTKEVLKKIREPIPLIRRGRKKLLKFLNNFCFLITYEVCKKRKYYNRKSEKKKILSF